jgi:hypothetical protein
MHGKRQACSELAVSSTYLLVLLLVSGSLNTFGQKKDKIDPREKVLGIDVPWSEGSALLDNGTELKGQLKYNEITGALSVRTDNDSRSLSSRSCPGFEFYDTRAQKQRVFFSLDYTNEEGVVIPMFFEALFQFKLFAVLRKQGVMKVKDKRSYSSTTDAYGNPTNQSRTQVEQEETIYLMNTRGVIKPFVEIRSTDRNVNMLDAERVSVQNEDFLEQLVGKKPYADLEAYRRENRLSFKDRAELMKVFEYYEEKWAR